jgi:hypothetical protein
MSEINPFEDKYWIPRGSNKFLSYVGPPLGDSPDRNELKVFLKKKNAFGAIWNYDYNYSDSGPWYKTVCDRKDYDTTIVDSKNSKKKINKCLSNCDLKPIDISIMLEKAYNVYVQACTRYKNADLIPEEKFRADLVNKFQKNNCKMFGVFFEDKLIAYMTVLDFDQYAMGDIAAFNPDYSNYYPMYGLYYYVAKYFVVERGYKEFDRGSKPLLHETDIDGFLVKLGYRKKYCRLGLYLNLPIRILLRFARVLRKLYKRILPHRLCAILDSLLLAQDIADTTHASAEVNHL